MAPLDYLVWILTFFTALTTGLFMFYAAHFEGSFIEPDAERFWPSKVESWRYCFGVLLGEFIVPNMQRRTTKLPSLRYGAIDLQ